MLNPRNAPLRHSICAAVPLWLGTSLAAFAAENPSILHMDGWSARCMQERCWRQSEIQFLSGSMPGSWRMRRMIAT